MRKKKKFQNSLIYDKFDLKLYGEKCLLTHIYIYIYIVHLDEYNMYENKRCGYKCGSSMIEFREIREKKKRIFLVWKAT